jgi:hypothetical protein
MRLLLELILEWNAIREFLGFESVALKNYLKHWDYFSKSSEQELDACKKLVHEPFLSLGHYKCICFYAFVEIIL